MNNTETHSAQEPMHFGWVLVWAFGLFQLGPLVREFLAWTDPVEGLKAGVIMGVFYLVPFVLLVLPWCLAVYLLYRWRRWRRYRTAWALLAPAGMLVFMLAALVRELPTEWGEFERLAGMPLPASATDVRSHREGGLDPQSVYTFSCSAAHTRALLAAMGLKESPVEVVDFRPVGSGIDFSSWEGKRAYSRWDEKGSRFYQMVTDGSETRVCVWVGSY